MEVLQIKSTPFTFYKEPGEMSRLVVCTHLNCDVFSPMILIFLEKGAMANRYSLGISIKSILRIPDIKVF